MTAPPFDDPNSPGAKLLRVLLHNFRLGRALGVEVRMYTGAVVFMPLVFASWLRPVCASDFELLALIAIAFVGIFAVIWTHEMGHILWGRRFRIETPLITLSPLGGVAHMGAAAPTPRSELLIALGGPAVHLIWLVVVMPAYKFLPSGLTAVHGWNNAPLDFALWFLQTINLSLLGFNLLPLFPLDGGHALRALLSMRMHANRATMICTAIGIGGGVIMAGYALTSGSVANSILFMIGITVVMGSLNERRAARHVPIYGARSQPTRMPWESDPDAWRRGGESSKPQVQGKPSKKSERHAAEDADLDRQLDDVLARLREVGLNGLTRKERDVLERASKRERGRR